ncbi:hypothetical protein M3Y95_00376300 [Aphelenchoides besseyi]|nr:hypothetical protein M3Y95_00376300 [Aphelenchoides besseyi]
MFLIAKIVRGRRLLHELEQAEKEKERERERQERQRAAADSLSIGSLNLRRGTTKKKSLHAIEGPSADLEYGAYDANGGRVGAPWFSTIHNDIRSTGPHTTKFV